MSRESFPVVNPPQVVLLHAETRTGIVLANHGGRYLAKGSEYTIFNSLQEAEAYARDFVARNQELECVILNHQRERVQWIRPGWTIEP